MKFFVNIKKDFSDLRLGNVLPVALFKLIGNLFGKPSISRLSAPLSLFSSMVGIASCPVAAFRMFPNGRHLRMKIRMTWSVKTVVEFISN